MEAMVARAQRWLVGVQRRGESLLLIGILILSLALRLYDVNWDEGHHAHPDERWISIVATEIRWPDDLSTAFDPHATTWNPLYNYNESKAAGEYRMRHFAYGHLPLYLLTVVAWALHNLAPLAEKLGAPEGLVHWLFMANTYDGFPQVGRHLSALFDTGTVLLIYWIGRRVYDRRVGLLAAAFSALTVIQIQLAHFYAFDPVATFFIMVALLGAIRMAQEGDVRSAVLAGVGAGCAVSSKFSALPILAALGIGALIPAWRALRRHGVNSPQMAVQLSRGVKLALIAILCAILSFAVTSPFALLDWKAYRISVIEEQGAMVRGKADFPYTRQYRGTTPYLYQIEQQVRWGMGWPLGVIAFLGFGWVLARAARGRARPEEWVLLSWAVPYFGITGAFMVKFMRYMLPVVPLFALMGAAMLWAWWDAGKRARELANQRESEPAGQQESESASQRIGEPAGQQDDLTQHATRDTHRSPRDYVLRIAYYAAPLLMALVLIGTAIWALAFVNGVYGSTHPWIQASRWFYENAPDGSVILWEYWDDPLPLQLSEPGMNMAAHGFRHIAWGPFEEDTPQKFELMKSMLRQADFISIASNRIYRAVPRLPQRYPMTIRYYQLLFEGKLGFEKAAEFTAYPRLDGLVFVDDDADESFTLYDHPKPMIFRKVRDLTDEEWDALLGGSWEGAIPYYTGSRQDRQREAASGGGRRKSLLLDRPVDELPVVYDFRWNRLASRSPALAVIVWWLALAVIGALAWPLTFAVFANLRDRGYPFARGLGWLVIGWIVWMLASLRIMRNALPTIYLALALLAALSYLLWRRHRAEMASFWRAQRALILLHEAVFGLAFLFFVFIRLLNPDLWQPWNGGEKFMEFAFLNAILRSPYFPPYDPYFAGGYMNYYYYGQYLVALLIKLTGIIPSVAFNLAVPTLFALTVSGAFGLVYNLVPVRREGRARFWAVGVGWGLLGGIFVALIGNLDGMGQVLRSLARIGGSEFESGIPGLQTLVRAIAGLRAVLFQGVPLPSYDYWGPSRVIPYTINEFPFWSFLFADLHPHMIGIPFTILFLGLAYNMVAGYGSSWTSEGRLEGALSFLALPLTLGALGVINTWDLPTYLGIGVLAFLLREWRGYGLRPPGALVWGRIRVRHLLLYVIGLIGLALGMYVPFYWHYAAVGSSGVGIVRHPKTQVTQWLMIWGFLIFLAIVFVFSEARQRPSRWRGADGRPLGFVRWVHLTLAHWDRPARLVELHRSLVRAPTVGYVLARWAVVLSLVIGVAALILGYRVVAFLWLPLLAAAFLLIRNTSSPEDLFTGALIFTGILVLAGVEVFFLKDFLCGCPPGSDTVGDFYRMNTLFKFYIQGWVLLGTGGAAALARLWPRVMTRWPRPWRVAWEGAFIVLLASSLVFPVLGTPARVNDRFPGPRPPRNTLDGMAYMTVGVYTWPNGNNPIELRYDYEAIRWMLDHIRGTPVVAEAPAGWYLVNGQNVGYDYYRAGGLRVSSMTGFPTLLGQHQGEQRYGDQVGRRENDGKELFQTTDPARAQALMDQLRITYLYIGKLERTLFSPESLAKFDQMVADGRLKIVYQNPQVTLYKVRWRE